MTLLQDFANNGFTGEYSVQLKYLYKQMVEREQGKTMQDLSDYINTNILIKQ